MDESVHKKPKKIFFDFLKLNYISFIPQRLTFDLWEYYFMKCFLKQRLGLAQHMKI